VDVAPQSITVELVDPEGVTSGTLVVTELPRRTTLVSRVDSPPSLREGATYRYTISGVQGPLVLEPAELFDPDDDAGHQGRLRPGLSVGRLVITARTANSTLNTFVDVAPAKLAQVREYQQMLRDIAHHATEAILQGFSPTSIDVVPGHESAELLYQQFAVLAARLQSEEFASAMARILQRPHQAWVTEVELRPAGASYPSGSAFARAVVAPGPRRRWSAGRTSALTSLPHRLPTSRHEPTTDTAPNRFVQFALESWRALAQRMRASLASHEGPIQAGPVRRGLRAADELLEILDEYLEHELFQGVGRLDHIPTGNQVLLKREGYRQIFHTFALIETGVALSFDRPATDDLTSASQRNVATLYEFWCYLVLAEVVGALCGVRQTARAFAPAANGMSLTLRAGHKSALSWEVERHGRRMAVELFFNRQFSVRSEAVHDGSWSSAMRPDCSVRIRPLSALPQRAQHRDLDVWLHFDAKYRVEHLAPLAVGNAARDAGDAEEADSFTRSKREDLLKMHAYRDAIRRTAGAYVLFPGDAPVQVREFAELLPGLGAFPLRPDADGEPGGADDLKAFLSDVFDHVSQQASSHERDRFWNATINERGPSEPARHAPVPFLDRPPADTDVLLGYVRSLDQLRWIDDTQSYNLRAGSREGAVELPGRELNAPLLLLYNSAPGGLQFVRLARRGPWHAVDDVDLEATGYPDPGGRLYFVTRLEVVPDMPAWLRRVDIERLRPADLPRGAPFVRTWWELLANASPG
jgi:predicted component of viral defense system (DUF524 family)